MGHILAQTEASLVKPLEVHKLVAEGWQLIKKRQLRKLTKLAGRSNDRWLVVKSTSQTSSFASNSVDEKKISKAKLSAEQKRKKWKINSGNFTKTSKSACDIQLFRGKIIYCISLWCLAKVRLPEHPTVIPLLLCV